MMKWNGGGRKQSWSNLKELFQHLHGGTEENHENRIIDLQAKI
jgi:hypothetical protein